MDPRVQRVLRRLAEIESGEETVTTARGSGRPNETARRAHARVTELLLEQGIVEVEHGGELARLQFPEAEVLRLLGTAGPDGKAAWGERLSADEAAARFLSIWLDESLATRQPHPSGWWAYRGAGFDPVPPWEAHARRRQRAWPESAVILEQHPEQTGGRR